jgi:hypothetical protein
LRWALAIRRVTFANGDHDGADSEATAEVVAERLVARIQQQGFDHLGRPRRGPCGLAGSDARKKSELPGATGGSLLS